MAHRRLGIALAWLATAFTAACSDSISGPGSEEVGAVLITAARTELHVGESVQLAVTLLGPTGAVTAGLPVTWTTSDPTVATVSPGGLVVATGGGLAFVEASAGGKTGSASIRVFPAPCTPAAAGRTIAPGESHTDSLTPGDCLLDGFPAQGWRLHLSQGTRLQLDLVSETFDAVLVVFDDAMNFVAWDDDGGEGLNSRVVREFGAGSYLIWAATWDLEVEGVYRLSVTEVDGASCEDPVGVLAADTTVVGTLSGASCIMEDGRHADPWLLELAAETSLRIDHMSHDFDAYLILTTADGEWVGEDDDGGGGLNSRLFVTLPAGHYIVWASTFWGSQAGDYTLSVRAMAAGNLGAALPALTPAPPARPADSGLPPRKPRP